ncbi:MAG: SlyX family protein [Gammaproteobacteria bacterium]|nr:SlyX family protein [Gammaproteobacteria bacterium]MBT8105389.1 SlyX family protein [Gammaproteobacteria bacterium]NNF48429.1 SlyX family protein [Woeseiaceae bacterium]NNK25403.1 SlyX family protein [Woeseiaceae bacterium]
MSEERIVELESKLAHQDQMLDQLNEVLTDQQARLMQMEELCHSLVERVRALGEASPDGNPDAERPPHY